jgi:hypothetical protein
MATWPTLTSKMDTSTSISYSPRVIVNDFGDGYQARVADGINNNPRSMTVQYVHMSPTDHHTLLAFVKTYSASGEGVVVPVLPEDETGATTALFMIQSGYSFSADEGGALYNWTIPLREVWIA